MAYIFDRVLVACTRRKHDRPMRAEDLYASDWFVKARDVAREFGKAWWILSAKHHLIEPDRVIAPYNISLQMLTAAERREWATRVCSILDGELAGDEWPSSMLVLAGHEYRQLITEHLSARGVEVATPLSDLGIGRQLRYLGTLSGMMPTVRLQDALYEQLARLSPGPDFPRLDELSSRSLPERGVYFFFDDSQKCRLRPKRLRLVRVGTHAVSRGSRSTLWQRLRTHRGVGSGGGSHRSSIFRLHVGNCIRLRESLRVDTWAIGSNAEKSVREAEAVLEQRVSEYIGRLRVAVLPVLDEPSPDSDRSFIEKNTIALVTHQATIDLPTRKWLGSFSPVPQIRASGLWNINYVGESFSADAIDVLERLVDNATSSFGPRTDSVAPSGWRKSPPSKVQLTLF